MVGLVASVTYVILILLVFELAADRNSAANRGGRAGALLLAALFVYVGDMKLVESKRYSKYVVCGEERQELRWPVWTDHRDILPLTIICVRVRCGTVRDKA